MDETAFLLFPYILLKKEATYLTFIDLCSMMITEQQFQGF